MFQVIGGNRYNSIKQAIAEIEVRQLITGEEYRLDGFELGDFDVSISHSDIVSAALRLGESIETATILAREYSNA